MKESAFFEVPGQGGNEAGTANAHMDDSVDSFGKENEGFVILEENEIIIHGEKYTIDQIDRLEQYLHECVENGFDITIIDRYASSKLYHKVLKLCEKKNYVVNERPE